MSFQDRLQIPVLSLDLSCIIFITEILKQQNEFRRPNIMRSFISFRKEAIGKNCFNYPPECIRPILIFDLGG